MRWTLRISFLLLLAWAIFLVSPFVALYDLSKAVQAKDSSISKFGIIGVSDSQLISA